MTNYLVCFYADPPSEPLHRVLVRQVSDAGACEKAKAHFRAKAVPDEELASFSLQPYGQARFDGVELI